MKDMIGADNIGQAGQTFIRFVVDTVREPFVVLDKDLKILSANQSFYDFFHVLNQETEGLKIYDIGNKQWDIPHLKKLLENIIPKETFFSDFEVEHDFNVIGKKTLLLNARMVFLKENSQPMIILAMEDISKQRLLDDKLRKYSEDLEEKVSERTGELASKVDELVRLNKLMVSREDEILKLRKQVDLLEGQLATKKGQKMQ